MPSYVSPKYATAFIFFVSLVDQSNTKLLKANPTIAAGDFKVSIDGGAFANLTTLPTVTPASGRSVKISLSAAEMTGDNIKVECVDASGAEWCDLAINIQTSARQIDDLAYPTVSGRSTDVSAGGEVGIDWANIGSPTTTVGLSGTTVKTATDVETDTQDIQTRIGTAGAGLTALGDTRIANLDATVSSRSSQTSVDDLPTNAELATSQASADDATLAAIAALNNLSEAGVRTAIGLASANLDTQLDALPTNTELATALGTSDDATLAAIAALNNLSAAQVNTEVDAALADYDAPTKAELDAAVANLATAANLATVAGYIDTEVASILAAVDTEIGALAVDVAAILADTGTDGVVVASASKSGYALSATGLDVIAVTAPSGVATTFPGMVVQLWRRFFRKTTLTATQLKTYADNGTTVVTTQTASDDLTTQTLGDAS